MDKEHQLLAANKEPDDPKLGERMPGTPPSAVREMEEKAKRDPNEPLSSDIENRFTHHPPSPEQIQKYQEIRDAAKDLAHLMDGHCPGSREKSLALTNLQQSVMWANASIACNEQQG